MQRPRLPKSRLEVWCDVATRTVSLGFSDLSDLFGSGHLSIGSRVLSARPHSSRLSEPSSNFRQASRNRLEDEVACLGRTRKVLQDVACEPIAEVLQTDRRLGVSA